MLQLGTICSVRMQGAIPPLLTSILDINLNTGTNLAVFVVNEMVSINNLIVLICALNIVDATQPLFSSSTHTHTHMQASANCSELLESLQISTKPFISWNRNPLDNWSGITPRTFSIVLNHDRRWRTWLTLHPVIPTYITVTSRYYVLYT